MQASPLAAEPVLCSEVESSSIEVSKGQEVRDRYRDYLAYAEMKQKCKP